MQNEEKLHSLLAVETSVKSQAQTMMADLKATFKTKRQLFGEKIVDFKPCIENVQAENKIQSTLNSTVLSELTSISKILGKMIDSGHHIDLGNTVAFADIILEDGAAIAKHIPTTSLLQLTKRLTEFYEILETVPTLDPAQGFTLDPSFRVKGVYKAREVIKDRTKTENEKYVIAGTLTKEHPAQCADRSITTVTGHIHELEWSGMITPAMKSTLLSRCEELIRAVKKARARANEQPVDVKSIKIGSDLLKHILQPLNTPPESPAAEVAA